MNGVFNTDLKRFNATILAPKTFGTEKFCHRCVLALTICRRRKRTWLFFTRHRLFFLTNFSVESFSIENSHVDASPEGYTMLPSDFP